MQTNLRRKEKYDLKVRGMIIPGQKTRFEDKIKRQIEIEEMVRKIVGADINMVYYMIFAKELERIKERHSGDTLYREADIIQKKWYERGLNNDRLNEIKHAMNIPTGIFRLDISLLDGTDTLA